MENNTILLPNGCYCSTPKICPKSAYGKKASTVKDWFIQYRFYDPTIVDDQGKIIPHQEVFRGMNHCKNLTDRRAVCRDHIQTEIENLHNGYNPAKKRFITHHDEIFAANKQTPFIKALWAAYKGITGVPGTLTDIKSVIKGVEQAAMELRFDMIPVSEISIRYIYAILERCRKLNKRFSDKRYNKYRAYLMKLFKQLRRMEAVQSNPMKDIDVIKIKKPIRRILTKEERTLIDSKLHDERYEFWRLLQIFFHSGSRETELMKVQAKHVDLDNQLCKYNVLKGEDRDVDRPIKTIVLSLWSELLAACKSPDDFLFSKNLHPGPLKIRPDQITRRWQKYVKWPADKGGMGIPAGFYSLKHSNYTETTDILNEKYSPKAADEIMIKQTSHKNTGMAVVYDKNRDSRHHKELIEVSNSFGEKVMSG